MQFNEQSKTRAEKTRSTNKAGGESFNPATPELALTKVVINNLLEDTYYESDEEAFEQVESQFEAVADSNPEFALKLAKYARQEENLRQVPQALFVLAAEDERTRPYIEDYARGIMSRTDEPLDVLALWKSRNGKTIPNALQRSIENAMHTWNEWQYAKWDQSGKQWQYRDLLNLVHPKPRDDERKAIFKKIAHGDLSDHPDVEPLKQEDTWESSLSDDSDNRSKDEKYREQLAEGNMGLFPRLRQARDMLESGVTADEIYGDVTDEWVGNSGLFPFRFYQAAKAVSESNSVPTGEGMKAEEYLEGFIDTASENLPDVLEDTFVAVDISGSMSSTVSGDSELQCVEIGSLFGAMLARRGAETVAFASNVADPNLNPRDTIMTNGQKIIDANVGGHSTNGYKVSQMLERDGKTPNQVIMFTDMQLWNDSGWMSDASFSDAWNSYASSVEDAPSLYLVDLNSYGDLAIPEGANNVYNISGWTENVIDFIDRMENVDDMIRTIEETSADE